jgi:dolichyl-diphosphooligosaccharide--protein glycosyltransferase
MFFAITKYKKIWSEIAAGLAGLFIVIYSVAWNSSWYLFLVLLPGLLGAIAIKAMHKIIQHKKIGKQLLFEAKETSILTGLFILSSWIFSILLTPSNIFSQIWKGLTSSYGAVASIQAGNIWPNVLSSVAELNPASFSSIIGSVGGRLIFTISILGLMLAAINFSTIKKEYRSYGAYILFGGFIWLLLFIARFSGGLNNLQSKLIGISNNNPALFLILFALPIIISSIGNIFLTTKTNNNWFVVITLTTWILGTMFMSFNGVRFILLLAPGFVIAFGFGLYQISKFIEEELLPLADIKKERMQKRISFALMLILFLVIFVPANASAQAQVKGAVPNFDDEWYTAMQNIKEDSQQDAIITSWWDFGHYFIAMSERGATFDGATQGTPRAHWVGRLFMENDEAKSKDMLRMLVCGGNQAFDKMMTYSQDSTNGVLVNKIIYDTFGVPLNQKAAVLEANKYFSFSEAEIEDIMTSLACEQPPENYVITSGDMIGKAGVWAHWGSWNFSRKYVLDNYQSMSVEEIASSIDEDQTAVQQLVEELELIDVRSRVENIKRNDLLNQWLAPYPNYAPVQGNYFVNCVEQNQTVYCPTGFDFNLETGEINVAPQVGVGVKNVVLIQNETITDYIQDSNAEFDVVIQQTANGYRSMLAQAPLGGSLFTKLYYLDGVGTESFELFDDRTSITGNRIRTWKVNWDS